jgi:hypothetical protein
VPQRLHLHVLSWLQEKEKLYLELKAILARQPGPEAAEQLSLYQARCHRLLAGWLLAGWPLVGCGGQLWTAACARVHPPASARAAAAVRLCC